jgi:hypothetical protein
MPNEPVSQTTQAEDRAWVFRVRRGRDDEVLMTIGGVEHVMSERQAETLGNMLRDCCQGASNDSGSVRT